MRRHLRSLILVASVFCGSVAIGPAAAETPSGDVAGHPWIGASAPAFELEGVDGRTLALEELRGRFVVIHFGASW